ncbi:MAG: DMT family transporter [Paracoccaceae bacterium]
MLSLSLGIGAALAWGLHDLLVRFATREIGAAWAFLLVLSGGLVMIFLVALAGGHVTRDMLAEFSAAAVALSVAAGLTYALAGYSLYRAFDEGPVRLVSPIVGAFPILSFCWAAWQGQTPSVGQWIAVFLVVAGVTISAHLTQEDAADGVEAEDQDAARRRRAAILWAVAAMAGFALTFAFGQAATAVVGTLPNVLLARFVSMLALGAAAFMIAPLPRLGQLPWQLLLVMGAADAGALSMVLAAGNLPHPEFASAASATFGMVTIVLAWLFLKERMSMAQWGAVGLVFASIGYLSL